GDDTTHDRGRAGVGDFGRRARTDLRRQCAGADEAVKVLASLRGAKRRSNLRRARHAQVEGDCFASLAMTVIARNDGNKGSAMKTQSIKVKLRDGEMGAYLAIPDWTPVGAIIAIMEIWGVNDTMRHHA